MPTNDETEQGYTPSETTKKALTTIRDSQAELYEELIDHLDKPLDRGKKKAPRPPVQFRALPDHDIRIDDTDQQTQPFPKRSENPVEFKSMSAARAFFNAPFSNKVFGTRIGNDYDEIDPQTNLIKRNYPPNQERYKTFGRIKNMSQIRDAFYEIMVKEPQFITETSTDNIIPSETREVFAPLAQKLVELSESDRDRVMNSIDRLGGPSHDLSKLATHHQFPLEKPQIQVRFNQTFIDRETIGQIAQAASNVSEQENDGMIASLKKRRDDNPFEYENNEEKRQYDTNIIRHFIKDITNEEILDQTTNWYRGNRFGNYKMVTLGITNEYSKDKAVEVDGKSIDENSLTNEASRAAEATPARDNSETAQWRQGNQPDNIENADAERDRNSASVDQSGANQSEQPATEQETSQSDAVPNIDIDEFLVTSATMAAPALQDNINPFPQEDNAALLPYVRAYLKTVDKYSAENPWLPIPNYKFGSELINTFVGQTRSTLGENAKFSEIDPAALLNEGGLSSSFRAMQGSFMQENREIFTNTFDGAADAATNPNWRNITLGLVKDQATEVSEKITDALVENIRLQNKNDSLLKLNIGREIAQAGQREQNLERYYAENLNYVYRQLERFGKLPNPGEPSNPQNPPGPGAVEPPASPQQRNTNADDRPQQHNVASAGNGSENGNGNPDSNVGTAQNSWKRPRDTNDNADDRAQPTKHARTATNEIGQSSEGSRNTGNANRSEPVIQGSQDDEIAPAPISEEGAREEDIIMTELERNLDFLEFQPLPQNPDLSKSLGARVGSPDGSNIFNLSSDEGEYRDNNQNDLQFNPPDTDFGDWFPMEPAAKADSQRADQSPSTSGEEFVDGTQPPSPVINDEDVVVEPTQQQSHQSQEVESEEQGPTNPVQGNNRAAQTGGMFDDLSPLEGVHLPSDSQDGSAGSKENSRHQLRSEENPANRSSVVRLGINNAANLSLTGAAQPNDSDLQTPQARTANLRELATGGTSAITSAEANGRTTDGSWRPTDTGERSAALQRNIGIRNVGRREVQILRDETSTRQLNFETPQRDQGTSQTNSDRELNSVVDRYVAVSSQTEREDIVAQLRDVITENQQHIDRTNELRDRYPGRTNNQIRDQLNQNSTLDNLDVDANVSLHRAGEAMERFYGLLAIGNTDQNRSPIAQDEFYNLGHIFSNEGRQSPNLSSSSRQDIMDRPTGSYGR